MRFCSELVLQTAILAALAGTAAKGEDAPRPRVVSVVRTDARTGRLVRSIVVKARPVGDDDGSGVRTLVEETAKNLDVSPLLVDSVIQVESNYNPYAISPKGAQGLMQLMPDTARRFGVKNSFDPQQNIEGGVRYLKFLQETFQDDRLAVAAYNAGEKAVTKYGNVPPYRETAAYVAKVNQKYTHARDAAAKKSPSAPEKTQPAEGETRHVVGYVDQEGRLHIATR